MEYRPFRYDYSKTIVHKMFLSEPDRKGGSRVFITFEKALELIKIIDRITQGLPKIIYLVGWQYNGHDDGYPEMFQVNKALKRPQDATALDSYLWLCREARKYNTVISVHTNFMDAYEESPLFGELVRENAIIKNADGSLRCVEIFNGRNGYKISAKQYWESGLFKRIADQFAASLPIAEAGTIHVDAFHVQNNYCPYTSIVEQQQARVRMWDYLRDLGVDVTSEGTYRELDDRMDCLDCPYVEKEGYTAEELVPDRWKESPLLNLGHIPYVWWLEHMTDEEWVAVPPSLYTGYPCERAYRRVFYGPIHGEDILLDQYKHTPLPQNPIAWTAKYMHEFFTCQLPYLYINRFKRLALETDETAEDRNGRLILRLSDGVICRGRHASIERNGVTLKWKDDVLLPLGDRKDCFVAYSANGRQGPWQIPDAEFVTATLHEITIYGNRLIGKAEILDGVITLSVRPGQAILITKAE